MSYTDGRVIYVEEDRASAVYLNGDLEADATLAEVDGRRRVVEMRITCPTGLLSEQVRRIPLQLIEARANDPHNADRGRSLSADLSVPDRKPYGKSFYETVADAYLRLAGAGKNPAVVMAEANGVPRSTVHRWIREARRHGIMPPGVSGRAG